MLVAGRFYFSSFGLSKKSCLFRKIPSTHFETDYNSKWAEGASVAPETAQTVLRRQAARYAAE